MQTLAPALISWEASGKIFLSGPHQLVGDANNNNNNNIIIIVTPKIVVKSRQVAEKYVESS